MRRDAVRGPRGAHATGWLDRIDGAALALLLCLPAASAHAYCRLTTAMPVAGAACSDHGTPLFWSRQCISYSIAVPAQSELDTTGLTVVKIRDVIDSSFASWLDVDCGGNTMGLSVEQTDQLSQCSKPQYNGNGPNVNSVIFVKDWAARKLPKEAFGLTLVWHNSTTGEIVDADMQLNETLGTLGACKITCPVGVVDLQNIVTHEAGHFLGLGHSSLPTACMFGKATIGETSKRYLTRDDQAGLCAIYANYKTPQCTDDDYQPDRGFGATCAPTNSSCSVGPKLTAREPFGFGAGLCVLALGWLVQRRRRAARY